MKIQGWVECAVLNDSMSYIDISTYLRTSPDLISDFISTKFGLLGLVAGTPVKLVGTETCDLGKKWCKLEVDIRDQSFWQKFKMPLWIAGFVVIGLAITDVLTPKRGWLTRKNRRIK